MPLTWSHAFVRVKNLEEMVNFYTSVLGFEVNDRSDSMVFVSQLNDEHHQLAFQSGLSDEKGPKRVGHFAFRVESLQEVRDLRDTLIKRSDVSYVAPITHGNTWSIYFADPEENGIEVFCDTPWDAVQPFGEPWDPALNDSELEQYTLNLIEQKGAVVANRRSL